MEVSGYLHVRANLPREGTQAPIEYEDGWAPETVWVFWRQIR
jgi:hypothetical protein